MARLILRKVDKHGGARYGVEGVRTSAYFPASMFNGEPPASFDVDEPSEQVQGPDGPLTNSEGEPVMRGLVFATETKASKRGDGTTSGVKVNAQMAAAREEAKRLREESKRVLREAREANKRGRKAPAAEQESLVEA
jgi:hypothetical protein